MTPCGHDPEAAYVTKRGRRGCRECDAAAWRSRPASPEPELDEPPSAAIPPGSVAVLASSLADSAMDAAPELSIDRFAAALEAWARSEALAMLIADRIDAVSPFNDRGQPRASLLAAYAAAERTASAARDAVGLTPRAASAILAAVRSGGIGLLSPSERLEAS